MGGVENGIVGAGYQTVDSVARASAGSGRSGGGDNRTGCWGEHRGLLDRGRFGPINDYFQRRRNEFFAEHLLGDLAHRNQVDIKN